MKLDAGDGHTLWQRLLDGPGHLDDRGWHVAVGADGHPVVTGHTPESETTASFFVAKLQGSDGSTIWSQTLPGAGSNPDDRSGRLVVLDDNDVILCDKTWSSTTSYDVVLHRFASADGSAVWHRQFNSGGTAADEARDMIRDLTGDYVYVAGLRAGDYAALKFRVSDGGLVWSGLYNGPPGWYDAASGVIEGPNGEVILSGYSSGATSGWDATTVAFDPADGAQLWVARFDGGYNETEEAPVMARNDLGDLFVCGYAYTPYTYSDMLTLHYFIEPAADAPEASLPVAFQAGPNPFRDALHLDLNLETPAEVSVTVLDAAGRRVALVREGLLDPGRHRIHWSPEGSRELPAGTYWIRAEVDGRAHSARVVRIR